MSRLRNFPETIYQGMTKNGELISLIRISYNRCLIISTIRSKEVAEALEKLGQRTAKYKIDGFQAKIIKPRKKAAKTPPDTPSEQDNQPAGQAEGTTQAVEGEPKAKRHHKTKAKFHCTNCDKDIEEPRITGAGGKQCPHCLKIGTISERDV